MYLIEVPQGSIFEVEDDIYLIKTPQGGVGRERFSKFIVKKTKKHVILVHTPLKNSFPSL